MSANQPKTSDRRPETTVIHIDKEMYKVSTDTMTVRDLLRLAGEEPAETTLVLRHGNEQTKYNDLDAPVRLSNGMQFVVFHNTPTTVS